MHQTVNRQPFTNGPAFVLKSRPLQHKSVARAVQQCTSGPRIAKRSSER